MGGPFGRGGGSRPDAGSDPRPGRAVAGLWPGGTVICVASGPGFTEAVAETCREAQVAGKARLIGVNEAWRRLPLDILYACDLAWWALHDGLPGFTGIRVSQDARACTRWPGIHRIPLRHEPGLSTDPALIHSGGNSGYQAVNVALHTGAARIILVGYDMRRGADGRAHWHGNHPPGMNNAPEDALARWVRAFDTIPPTVPAGVEIINATPGSAVTAFPFAPLETLF